MKGSRGGSIVAHTFSYGSTLLFLFPVYVLINLAIRPASELISPLSPTTHPTFGNFIDAWKQSGLGWAIVTSVIVTVVSCVPITIFSLMASYPLARSTARLSRTTFYFFLVGLLLPFQVAFLPLYLMMRDLQLLGTVWSLVLFYTGLQMPFSIFLMTTFLRSSVEQEFEEAAHIDGASHFKTFLYIVVPLLRPVVGTMLILNGVAIWNDFFTPLLYLSGSNISTIPVALYSFVGVYVSNWPLVFAALIISMSPILALFVAFQRYVIRGFAGGLKG